MKKRLVVALSLVGIGFSSSGAWSAPRSTTLLKTNTTWNGTDIKYLKTHCPEVSAVVVEIPPGESTAVHLHPVNNYAFIISGRIHLEAGDMIAGRWVVETSHDYAAGDAFAELVNTWHRGTAGPDGVKILVWYTGEAGAPHTVPYAPDYKARTSPRDDSKCEPPHRPERGP